VFTNLRLVKVYPQLAGLSPVKSELLDGVDMIVVRELTGGLYFGQPKGRGMVDGRERAIDTLEYYEYEIRRIAEMAFRLARGRRKKVTSIDKANVLESSRLWRQVVSQVHTGYPDVELEHMLVDTAAMRLVASPARFDVVVTENMFGDILTDEASVLAGSMGLLPSASLGEAGPGLYEPIHGSAPDIAGQGVANPIGTILSAALMLRYSLQLEDAAQKIENAVEKAVASRQLTRDLGGSLSTEQMADAIIAHLN
jgi:3-isopropylmalate dehydrogenase